MTEKLGGGKKETKTECEDKNREGSRGRRDGGRQRTDEERKLELGFFVCFL